MALSIGAVNASAVDPLEAYMNKIRLNELLATGLTGAGINIGQIESGSPRATHGSFAGVTILSRAGAAMTDHATGTGALMVGQRTAAGGNFQGVATGGALYSSGIGAVPANGAWATRIKELMDWQMEEPATSVVNNSWSMLQPGATFGTAVDRANVARVYDWASTKGLLQVTAAGNSGTVAGTGANNSGNVSAPGIGYNTLTVGATGGAGNWNRVAGFSSISAEDAMGNPSATLRVDIVAPGVGIKTATGAANAYVPSSGTSFATPLVTGVVALLQQHGGNKGFSADPRLMRAILMNSANKTVENRAGVRWDQEFKAQANGVTATRMSNQTGTGQLDAMEAYTQYDAGRSRATTKFGNSFPGSGEVKSTGWDVDAATTGVGNVYVTADVLRKGTYLTSTLTWNREVDSTDANVENWTYKDLAQLNLGIRQYLGGPGGTNSNFGGDDPNLNGTSQHNVTKLLARNKYVMFVAYRDTTPVSGTTYALAWRSYVMDGHNVQSFNGGFDGDRGAYRDNGWFQAANAVSYGQAVREAWMPGNDSNWAMRMVSGAGLPGGIAQEVVRPFSFFVVTFDIAFGAANFLSRVDVFLGNLLLGSVSADGSNTQAFQFIGNFALDSNQLAGLAPGSFVDLSFKFFSLDVNTAFIDNVEYIPSAPTVALLGLAGVMAGRRRRG
jgi:hypothetical protein